MFENHFAAAIPPHFSSTTTNEKTNNKGNWIDRNRKLLALLCMFYITNASRPEKSIPLHYAEQQKNSVVFI